MQQCMHERGQIRQIEERAEREGKGQGEQRWRGEGERRGREERGRS